jgi:hypothetical protein
MVICSDIVKDTAKILHRKSTQMNRQYNKSSTDMAFRCIDIVYDQSKPLRIVLPCLSLTPTIYDKLNFINVINQHIQ